MTLPDFSKVHILVIGDVMLDRYWYGKTSRISPEAPVPVVQLSNFEEKPGGASNVALNTASLGCQTTLLGLIGDDPEAEVLTRLLNEKHILFHPVKIKNKKTITKSRVLSHHQQLIRLDVDEFFSQSDASQLLPLFEEHLSKNTVVIISDYAKGIQSIVPQLIQTAQKLEIPVLVDPKTADMRIYKNASVITPNLLEFEAAVGSSSQESEWVTKGFQLMKQNHWQALLVTRGERGMSLLQNDGGVHHFPADTKEVFDVTGAGDTVIAVLAAAWGGGLPLVDATALANKAAGLVISKLGAASVAPSELQAVLCPSTKDAAKILTEESILQKVNVLRKQGKTIVMTNGCFDILHAGHVTYLSAAKQLGSYLIVAVNDDQSVRELKGVHRPVNPLEARMRVLASLSSVDAIVPFSESTPERLIGSIKPNVLVKGGDWTQEQIAGSASVIQNGGRVEVLPLVPECSTTQTIRKIVQKHSPLLS